MGRVKTKLFEEFDKDWEFCFSENEKLAKIIWKQKICIEIWVWNWRFFSHIVKRNQDLFYIWCDLRKDRLVKTKRKVEEISNNKNFALSFWDAREILEFLENWSIQEFYMNFPDPRPPKWEWKYRFFQLEIIEILHKKMVKWWKIFIKTDDFEYFYFTRTAFFFKKSLFREFSHSKDVYKEQNTKVEEYICTEFEEKWLKKWKKIFELVFEKK